MSVNPSVMNLLSVPIRASVRKRSGSFSETMNVARSLSTERPGTPRPCDVQDSSGFKKPLKRDHFFGSLDSISSNNVSKLGDVAWKTTSSMKAADSSDFMKRAFSTEAMEVKDSARTSRVYRHLETVLNDEELMKVDNFSKYTPTSVSLSHFLDHGSGGGSIEESYLFLRKEIPVRLSNIMKEFESLPDVLSSEPAVKEILSQYGQSFKEMLQFENAENDPETHLRFTETITNIKQRHQDTVPRMADALHSLREKGSLHVNKRDKLNKKVHYFLDRLYTMRISVQMLISHHKRFFCSPGDPNYYPCKQGTIEPKCDPAAIAQEAFENAQLVCEQIYMDSPKVNIKVHNMVTNTDEVDFVYIPGHLYHMFFEIFKNSMRATMEYHEDAEKVPDIDVLIAKSHHDITIKISDQGGGINKKTVENVFLYLYTSATRVKLGGGDMGGTTSNSTPMHGLGYGLPLSKLYAEYFGGDIKIASVDGHGTDAYIYLKALETDAKENLPIYNARSAMKLKDTTIQVDDWTKDS